MALSKAIIGELRSILREEYGADVNDVEAAEIGTNLVRYFDLLAQIDHRASQESAQKERAPP